MSAHGVSFRPRLFPFRILFMDDRLASLLERFQLRARVFQAGPLCRVGRFDAGDDLGYLHVLRGGALRLESAGQPARVLTEPCVFLYMSPAWHRLTPLEDGAQMVCASFDWSAGAGNPLAAALPEVILVPLASAPSLDAVLALLFAEACEEHCGRQAVLDRLSEVVIVHLLRDLMDQGRLEVGLLAGLADPRLVHALNAVHADPARAWTLSELAAKAGLSRARFANRFREVVGQTPGAYLAEWRLGLARALLLRGKPVKVIANEVGYGNPSALSRAFRSRLGRSPREWLRALSQARPAPAGGTAGNASAGGAAHRRSSPARGTAGGEAAPARGTAAASEVTAT